MTDCDLSTWSDVQFDTYLKYRTMKKLLSRCDPYIFFTSLRPFLSSFSDGKGRTDGLIFEGVPEFENKPQKFTGASGAQSSVLPVLDEFLGVSHNEGRLKDILLNMLKYMPKPHSKFASSIPQSGLRKYIESNLSHPGLTDSYDDILDQVVIFRKIHLSFATKYLVRQAESTGSKVILGTGGAPFMKYLTDHLKTTKRMQFRFKYTKTALARGRIRDLLAYLPEGWGSDRIVDVEPQIQTRWKKIIFFVLVAVAFYLIFCKVLLI